MLISLAAAWFEKGSISFERSNYDDAIVAYRKALELDDQMAQVWQELGNVYSKKGMHDDAIKAYENAVRIDPDRMLEVAAKKDLCIKASEELSERKKYLEEKERLLRDKEKLQFQNETLQQQRDEYHKEKDLQLEKAEKLQIVELMDKACGGLDEGYLSHDDWHKYMGTEAYRETCPCSIPIRKPLISADSM